MNKLPLFPLRKLLKESGDMLGKDLGHFTKKEMKAFVKALLDTDYCCCDYPCEDCFRHVESNIDFPDSIER